MSTLGPRTPSGPLPQGWGGGVRSWVSWSGRPCRVVFNAPTRYALRATPTAQGSAISSPLRSPTGCRAGRVPPRKDREGGRAIVCFPRRTQIYVVAKLATPLDGRSGSEMRDLRWPFYSAQTPPSSMLKSDTVPFLARLGGSVRLLAELAIRRRDSRPAGASWGTRLRSLSCKSPRIGPQSLAGATDARHPNRLRFRAPTKILTPNI